MTNKEKAPGRRNQGARRKQQRTMFSAFIVTQSPPNVQLSELDSSIEIAREWLAHLFASDDDADQWRLAYVWPEYLRQRQLWSEVVR